MEKAAIAAFSFAWSQEIDLPLLAQDCKAFPGPKKEARITAGFFLSTQSLSSE